VAKPTEKPAPPKARGSLATRLFLVSGAVVALALATAVLTTSLVGHRVAEKFLSAQLKRSSEVQSDLGQAELDSLNVQALTVSTNPDFVSYLVEAIASNDALSLTDQLDERQRDLGFSFAIVLDPQGRIVVRTDQQGGKPDMADEAIFKAAAESSESTADGMWARDGKLYYAVVVPLASDSVLQGYLLLAYQVDDATAARLSSSTATQVVFLLNGPQGGYQVAATSIEGESGKELPALAARTPELFQGTAEEPRQVVAEIGGRSFRVQAKPIYGIGGMKIGQVLNLGSMEEALEPFIKIQRALMVVGLLAVVVALVASFFVAKILLQPIRELAVAADKAAGGEFNQSIDGSSGGAEVDQLATTFNTLLSELREKRDMQVYLSELSRTLPDQVEGVAVSSEPAQQRSGTLLAFELRGYARTIAAEVPARVTLERLAKDLRRLTQPIAAGGGNIEATVGHRVIASFEGPKKTERALSAAADIVAHGKELDTAVVLATGALVSGSITWQTKPSFGLIGEVVDAVENLLRVARPGVLLMSRASRYELSQVPALARLPIQEHKSSISEQPLYSLPAEAAQLLASPELGATQEMTVDGTTANRTTPWGTMSTTLSGIGPGSVLGDRFEIVSQLGVGGMGVVYKARDRKLHELVALKMLKHDAYSDEQSLEKLKDELKLARKISHPNVLRTFDFGEAEGFPFISMEFVRGVTLKKLLDESGRLPLSAGLHIARQLCRGLQAAHAQAVLHRDIKPENMIIEATGNTKLMDFGIAQPIQRQRAGQSRDGSVVGTPYYLAPEQIEGIEPDVRADIYATGVVLFEIFTGELPFPATGSLMQIITRKLNEEPFKPGIFWGDIPKDLERLIMRCLERDREKRFANVALLLKELEALRA
jgi:eukaryotic-like serine/threonine-protein kinase